MDIIKQIIKKVRSMYRYDNRVRDILLLPASIRVQENEDESIYVASIIFGTSDIVAVSSNVIKYYSFTKNEWETLIEYSDYNELLNM